MKDKTILRLGGACSILVGVASALYGIVYVLLPAKQRVGVGAAEFLPSLATEGSTLLLLEFYLMAAASILGLAVIPAVASLVREVNEGWTRWTSTLAQIGFAVNAVSTMLMAARFPILANAFVAGDASTKAALAATWRTSLDHHGLWGWGAVGLWILVMSWLALRGRNLPSSLVYVGLALGIAFILLPVLIFAQQQPLITFVAPVGVILALVWYGWLGVILRRT